MRPREEIWVGFFGIWNDKEVAETWHRWFDTEKEGHKPEQDEREVLAMAGGDEREAEEGDEDNGK